jgi:hypothetical protein
MQIFYVSRRSRISTGAFNLLNTRHYAIPLIEAGYEWIYQTKTHGTLRSTEYSPPEKSLLDSPPGHGLLTAWKRASFTCIGRHFALIDTLGYKSIFYDSHPLCSPTRITPVTNNIAQLVSLDFGFQTLVIGNTHLYWRPEATYEKLRQLYILLDVSV